MTVIAGLCAKGSPGVSLAVWTIVHLWPRQAIAIELDEAGGTWALRHGLTTEPGLASLASTQDHLNHRVASGHGHEVAPDRHVVCAPRESNIIGAALVWLDERLRAWPNDNDLLVDVGRVRSNTIRDNAAIARADTLLVFTRPRPEDLGPLAHLLTELGAATAATTDLQVVVVGSSPYSPEAAVDALRDLSGVARIRLGAAIPDDPLTAAAIARGGRKGTKVAARWFGPLVNELASGSAHRSPTHVGTVR